MYIFCVGTNKAVINSKIFFNISVYKTRETCYIHGILLELSYSMIWRTPSGALTQNEQIWKHKSCYQLAELIVPLLLWHVPHSPSCYCFVITPASRCPLSWVAFHFSLGASLCFSSHVLQRNSWFLMVVQPQTWLLSCLNNTISNIIMTILRCFISNITSWGNGVSVF